MVESGPPAELERLFAARSLVLSRASLPSQPVAMVVEDPVTLVVACQLASEGLLEQPTTSEIQGTRHIGLRLTAKGVEYRNDLGPWS
jgi:hypothetical protein